MVIEPAPLPCSSPPKLRSPDLYYLPAKAHPEIFAHKTVGQVADHFDQILRGLTRKPAIGGHSSGGLLVQILAGRLETAGTSPGRTARR
jgi:hypothetical protein